ncbi:MAG TPA: hypothetical protein VGF97_04660 [Rhizomicrobium sp.]|jgi:hypothetical protein
MKLAFPIAAATLLLAGMPAFAIETVTLPQTSNDGSPQATDAANNSGFSSQPKSDPGLLDQFHLSVSSSQTNMFGQPESWSTPSSSSQAGYFDPKQAGSEFYSSGGSTYPH